MNDNQPQGTTGGVTQNSTPMITSMNTAANQMNTQGGTKQLPPHKSNETGPLIAIIIVVLVIVLGGLYFWGQRLNESSTTAGDQSAAAQEAQTQKIKTVNSSDDVNAIQADLNATSYTSVDSNLNNMEAASK
jgi:uncharacterized protein HemX